MVDDNDREYHRRIIRDILAWKEAPPSVVSRGMGVAAYPLEWLVERLIPHAAIEGALSAFDWVGKNTTTPPGGGSDALRSCDRYCDQVINFHIGVCSAEGGAAGFFGLPGMVVDVPAVILLAVRTVRQISREYGYAEDTEQERKFALSALSAASANNQKQKAAAIVAGRYLTTLISKNTWKSMAEKSVGPEAAVIAVKTLAKQLGINITKRSALAAIPVVGAGVGLTVNGLFIRDIGNTAQKFYQERWLKDHKCWVEEDPSSGEA